MISRVAFFRYGLSCIIADSLIDMRKIANIDQEWAVAASGAKQQAESSSIDDEHGARSPALTLITIPVGNFISYNRRLRRLHLQTLGYSLPVGEICYPVTMYANLGC